MHKGAVQISSDPVLELLLVAKLELRGCLCHPRPRTQVNHRHLDIHEDEVGAFGLGDAGFPVRRLDDRIARADQEVAEHASLFLVVNDEDGLVHGALS
jgi:hypothetical protein